MSLILCLCGGCFAEKQPPKQPTPQRVERVDTILKDTADDTALGVDARSIVYKQDRRLEKQFSRNYYDPVNILTGGLILVTLVLLHHCWTCGKKDAK